MQRILLMINVSRRMKPSTLDPKMTLLQGLTRTPGSRSRPWIAVWPQTRSAFSFFCKYGQKVGCLSTWAKSQSSQEKELLVWNNTQKKISCWFRKKTVLIFSVLNVPYVLWYGTGTVSIQKENSRFWKCFQLYFYKPLDLVICCGSGSIYSHSRIGSVFKIFQIQS